MYSYSVHNLHTCNRGRMDEMIIRLLSTTTAKDNCNLAIEDVNYNLETKNFVRTQLQKLDQLSETS